MSFQVQSSDGYSKGFPMTFTYWVTDAGVAFIKRFTEGADIS